MQLDNLWAKVSNEKEIVGKRKESKRTFHRIVEKKKE
jgi:hypothetical protein